MRQLPPAPLFPCPSRLQCPNALLIRASSDVSVPIAPPACSRKPTDRSTGRRLVPFELAPTEMRDRKSTRLNSSPGYISYALFFFNDTTTTEIYTLSLHDALPIAPPPCSRKPTHRPPGRRLVPFELAPTDL